MFEKEVIIPQQLFTKNKALLWLLAGFVFLFCQQDAYSQVQTGIVKGIVKDSEGKPLISNIVLLENQNISTSSNDKGEYEIKVPTDRSYTLVFTSLNTEVVKQKIFANARSIIELNIKAKVKVNQIPEIEVTDNSKRTEAGSVEVKANSGQLLPSVNESIEGLLAAQALGVQKNNELSSNYSVRGGNFDENLVYVNDFEVYRPFLIRSGQQEGLSFANPNLVQNIKFTSGGFQARYGDKMSSVMDVTYKRPQKFGGSFSASLLGLSGHLEGASKNKRFTFLVGVRQRLSQYILKSLETSGQYSPNFLDVQGFFTYQINPKWSMEFISNYSRNSYNFKPVSRETTFGYITDVKRLTIYFDGQEADRYQTIMNGLSLNYQPKDNLKLKILGSVYLNQEREAYDILGEYYLSQVENDLSKDNFGDILYSLGIGGLQNWARNTLHTEVYYAGFRGSWMKKGHNVQWGVDYKREYIQDKLSEWNRLDSAGYSLPLLPDHIDFENVELNRTLKTTNIIKNNRIAAFIQDTWKFGDTTQFSFTYGLRYNYATLNKEALVLSPRVQFSVKPHMKPDMIFNVSGGLYYQPPFYREMRNLEGVVNTNLRSQKSAHAIAGMNYAFKIAKRPFSFVTEVYYKYMWDMVPYEFDNVLIRYFGTNQSRGYSAGIDLRLNGELADGDESWMSLSIMKSAEDIVGDKYTEYYDSAGNTIPNTRTYQSQIRDSSTVNPGFIPRPTDQRVNFAMFFQDHIPRFPYIKMHLSLVFGTGLPFGPPDNNRYKDVLRIPPYRRVDIGFSGQLWNREWSKKKGKAFGNILKGVWLSVEVYNLLGISNTVSYLWIKDVSNNQYAVPNYLTSRRINAKVVVNF